MYSINIIVKVLLIFTFNTLEASANNITNIVNDMGYSIDCIKNKYFLIRNDIFSPGNSVSTNYGTYSDSLILISSQLNKCRYEFFEKLIDLDIGQKHIDKISKIKLKSELLNNSISVLYLINIYYSASFKNKFISFGDYKTKVNRLIKFENSLSQIE